MFKTPILMLKMKFFWLIFRGKFEQKTQKSIFLKNQWRLKNIKKAMVVKNIIAEDMPFTKSIFEQFWRSYCKKTIFVVFHFLKFMPNDNTTIRRWLIITRCEQLIFPTLSCSRQGSGRHNNDEWSSRCQWRLSLERLGLGWAGGYSYPLSTSLPLLYISPSMCYY